MIDERTVYSGLIAFLLGPLSTFLPRLRNAVSSSSRQDELELFVLSCGDGAPPPPSP